MTSWLSFFVRSAFLVLVGLAPHIVCSAFVASHRSCNLRPAMMPRQASRSGIIYVPDDPINTPVVQLFTRNGCATCDTVMETLRSVSRESPHILELVDIDDPEHQSWHDRYKYDLPILRINDIYWTTARLTVHEAKAGIYAATAGFFVKGRSEPNFKQVELQMMQPPSTPKQVKGENEDGKEQETVNPRRASSGSFQKMMVKAIRDRHEKRGCHIQELNKLE